MHSSSRYTWRHELVLTDPTTPRSLVSLLPEAMVQQLLLVWNTHANLFKLSERDLAKELRRQGKTVGPLDHKLRVRFWAEFDRVQSITRDDGQTPKFSMAHVIGNDFPKETFYRYYITDPGKLAFLLCPPTDYKLLLEIVLVQGLFTLLEFVNSLDPNDPEKSKYIMQLIKIQRELGMRKLILEGKASGHHVKAPAQAPVAEPDSTSLADLSNDPTTV